MKLPFLRKAAAEEPLVVSMAGVRMGEAVVFAGRSPALALPLAARTGLSGRCLVVGPAEATARIEGSATRDGHLVEVAAQPPADASFDLAVVEAVGDWASAAAACRPAVRPGGRIVVVAGSPREGIVARLTRAQAEAPPADALVRALAEAGWHRARPVGERGGLLFVEAFN